MSLGDIHLYYFCSRGTGLADWRRAGILDRELGFVAALGDGMKSATLVSYGGASDLALARGHPNVQLSVNRLHLPRKLRAFEVSQIAPLCWRRPAIVMSSQVSGSRQARLAARRLDAPFVARCGYLLSDFEIPKHGRDSATVRRIIALERETFGLADEVVVTTEAMRDTVLSYDVAFGRITVIPNFVDTDLFSPRPPQSVDERKISFVGRFAEQKNLHILVDALAGLDVTLELIGDGPLREAIIEQARKRGVRLSLPGVISNARLPERLAQTSVFVLPSQQEGHPKVLIEAMAAGRAVVGTRVPGIANVLADGIDGLLAEPEAQSLRAAIMRVLEDPALAARLGANARNTAVARYSRAGVIAAFREVFARAVAAKRQ